MAPPESSCINFSKIPLIITESKVSIEGIEKFLLIGRVRITVWKIVSSGSNSIGTISWIFSISEFDSLKTSPKSLVDFFNSF